MRVPSWPDRAAAERLLAGDHADTPVGRVLAHAGRPAGPHELAGEDAAVAAFRAAAAAPAARRRRLVSRVLALKLTAAAVLLTGSGLAVAGVTGNLPLPARDDLRPAPTAPRDRQPPAPSAEVRDPARVPPPVPATSTSPPTTTKPDKSKGPKGPKEHPHTPNPHGNGAHPTPGWQKHASEKPPASHP